MATWLVLGLIAGFLVWRTGGLEAAIAAHVVSNVLVYLGAALTTSVASVRAAQGIDSRAYLICLAT